MHVLVLSHLYPRPHDPSYGIFVHRQIKQLQQTGVEVTVLSPTPWLPPELRGRKKWQSYNQTPTSIQWEGVNVYYPRYVRPPGHWFRALAGVTAYWGVLSLAQSIHLTKPFDLIHANFLLPDGLAGVYLGQKLKLPTVCTVRGADINLHPHENRLNLYATQTIIRKTDKISSVSQAIKQAVEQLARPVRPVSVIYNGVNQQEFSTEFDDAAPQIFSQIAAFKPYILFIGRDIERKGLNDLLLAFGRIADQADCCLVVIGPTFNQVKTQFPELARALGEKLVMLGVVAPKQIPLYTQHCEFLVLPSYSEGLPNVVLEAMACGKAVVATDVAGTPEAVVGGATGLLIQPGDRDALQAALQLLIDDPHLRWQMGQHGRARVTKMFTWEKNASELISIYQELLSADE